MRVGIYTNIFKDKNLSVTKNLIESFSSHGIVCLAHENLRDKVRCNGYMSESDEGTLPDMMLAVGGDGTLLGIAKWCAVRKIPVLGVNLGKLGFLTEAEPDNFDALAKDLAAQKYSVEKRTMLCAQWRDKRFYALNEIVITRRNVSKMIVLKVDIEGAPLDKHYCDGFIVSTPTGSTAYSLSAGGPVISPTANVFALTPVNSHSMHSRPVVIGDDEKIDITLLARADDAMVLADGKNVICLPEKQTIRIGKATKRALFVRLHKNGFYERLLRKLNTWSITPSEEDAK
ncbi:MAG: NAD(+)/NADH kinase [Clostridia bacterium]|nr:NAD(+)/NADH kinase [Clostridia bacterium]